MVTTVPVDKTFGFVRVYRLGNPILFAAVPCFLAGFSMDPSLPNDQEFLQLTVEGFSGVVKDVGGEGGFLHMQTEWNFQAHVLDYGDLTYKPLLSPFDVGLTLTLYHGDNRQHEVSIITFINKEKLDDLVPLHSCGRYQVFLSFLRSWASMKRCSCR